MITPMILRDLLADFYLVEMIVFAILPFYTLLRSLFSDLYPGEFIQLLLFKVMPLHYIVFCINYWFAQQTITYQILQCQGDACPWLEIHSGLLLIIVCYLTMIKLYVRMIHSNRL